MLDYSSVMAAADIVPFARNVDWHTLPAETSELFTALDALAAQVTDEQLTFVPHEPQADEERGWTIPHIVAHLTASAEESGALAAELARGILVEKRSRYEVPWQEITTAQQVRDRLRESRHICLSYLGAWPEQPQLEVSYEPFPGAGELNATARYLLGLIHTHTHLGHLRETLRQAQAH